MKNIQTGTGRYVSMRISTWISVDVCHLSGRSYIYLSVTSMSEGCCLSVRPECSQLSRRVKRRGRWFYTQTRSVPIVGNTSPTQHPNLQPDRLTQVTKTAVVVFFPAQTDKVPWNGSDV